MANFPMGNTDEWTVQRPRLVLEYGREAFSYEDTEEHSVHGFMHELTDQPTGEPPHSKGETRKAVFTALYDGGDLLHKGDVLTRGADSWLVDEVVRIEKNPFTGWQPTYEARCSTWRG